MNYQLRKYQSDAIKAATDHFFSGGSSAIAVLATGTGKTIILTNVADIMHRRDGKRCIIIAHRDELIRSAAEKIREVTGIAPEIEKAEERAAREDGLGMSRSPYVVASIQTLLSGKGARKRMHDFDPAEFDLVIIDESHHAAAEGYQAVINYFTSQGAKLFGATATADRADGVSLGSTFEEVIARYELPDAVADGYLVPIRMRSVIVDGLNYSKCRTTKAGHLHDDDVATALEAAMQDEADWHPVAHAVLECACGLEPGTLADCRDLPFDERAMRLLDLLDGRPVKRTLIFCPKVATSQRLADIFNRWMDGIAAHVDGETQAEERQRIFADFTKGTCPILSNVGVAEEGTDLPATEIVVLVAKTKSRPKVSQRVGRGTRPHPTIAHKLSEPGLTAEQRRQLIQASPKQSCLVLDFIGDAGPHQLVGPADLLAGDEIDSNVLRRAQEIADGREIPVEQAIEEAEAELEQEKELAQKLAEREQKELEAEATMKFYADMRRNIVATTNYQLTDASGEAVAPSPEPQGIGSATDGQIDLLIRFGVKPSTARAMTKGQAGKVIDTYKTGRARRGLGNPPSVKQINSLVRAGYDRGEVARYLDFDNCRRLMDAVVANGWKAIGPDVPSSLRTVGIAPKGDAA